MSYCTQPAAANYNTAPLHNERQRGYRICDQCGTVETSAVKFRLCGGCVRSFNVLHTSIVADHRLLYYNLVDHTILCMFSSIVLPP
jgi:ribosomal protein S14